MGDKMKEIILVGTLNKDSCLPTMRKESQLLEYFFVWTGTEIELIGLTYDSPHRKLLREATVDEMEGILNWMGDICKSKNIDFNTYARSLSLNLKCKSR